jgi:Thermolysin metallopeptidase, alpha-helical domain/Thermolysin metallopeptidase, catalytic domain
MSEIKLKTICGCCFIIPTNVLKKLSASIDPDIAARAARTIRLTNTLAAFRAELNTGAPPPLALTRTGLRRQVFDCGATEDIPGDFKRAEQDPQTADLAVNQAFDNAGLSWKFYKDIFNRESVDNAGKTLVSSVHFSQGYDNAFWNGQQMVYGDGDGKIFKGFTSAVDVIAHELTHGVTQFTAQLPYRGQSGALNESMSDVFGSMVKQWSKGQTADQADWLIGADIFTPSFKGRALRDMENPGTAFDDPVLGKDPQPAHMQDYVNLPDDDDNGGVHINSGIPNRAFVLAAKAIGGRSWEVTGKIWYVVLTERLTSAADFAKCAAETISVARDLFPADPSISAKVAKAWVDVGVLAQTDAPVASLAVSEAARLSVMSLQAVCTVRHGHRYAATVVPSGFEQFASNSDIADRLKRYGFVDVVVTGSGSTRRAEATWNGTDTTAQLDSHLRDITEIAVATAPSSGVATNAASAPAPLVVGGRSKLRAKKPRKRSEEIVPNSEGSGPESDRQL